MSDTSKQHQFLWAVQTIALAALVEAGEQTNPNQQFDMESFVAVALHAVERIPESMRVIDAAHDFCNHMIPTKREAGANCPAWFAN